MGLDLKENSTLYEIGITHFAALTISIYRHFSLTRFYHDDSTPLGFTHFSVTTQYHQHVGGLRSVWNSLDTTCYHITYSVQLYHLAFSATLDTYLKPSGTASGHQWGYPIILLQVTPWSVSVSARCRLTTTLIGSFSTTSGVLDNSIGFLILWNGLKFPPQSDQFK